MTETPVIVQWLADGVLNLSFNRPARRNAFNSEMYAACAESIDQAGHDPAVRVIVLSGAGDCFTAGNDLADFVPPPAELAAMRLFRALLNCPKPVIAAIEKAAIGSGLTLLAYCDFAYAGRSTRFAAPFVKLGVCAEGGSSLWLPRLAGHKRALAMLLLGDPFPATEALACGLLTEVVEDGTALASAEACAIRLAALPAAVVQANKRLLTRHDQTALEAALAREEALFLSLLADDTAQQAIGQFLGRR